MFRTSNVLCIFFHLRNIFSMKKLLILPLLQASAFYFHPLHQPYFATSHLKVPSWKQLDAYKPIYDDAPSTSKTPLHPKAGDVVRYYDIDGGKVDGQVLVGKIAYIQKILGSDAWSVEITQLQDVGDGYFAEYSSRLRQSKKTMRPLSEVAPIAASYVRSEAAFKVPRTAEGEPAVRAERYDIETYSGPFSGDSSINIDVLQADQEKYEALKFKLIKETAILSLLVVAVVDLIKGSQDAAIYAAGALAGLVYLILLSIKTDTLGSPQAKLGSNVSNLRFAMPLLVFVGVATYNNVVLGVNSPVSTSTNLFQTVSPEQFAAITIGFLTYRIPLFANQISDLLKDGSTLLPGSVGVAMSLVKKEVSETTLRTSASDDLTTVLVVSGPQAAGRTELVERLIAESEGRYVSPIPVDRNEDGARFELLESRNELITVDNSGRYGVTKEGILRGAMAPNSVVVMDATVETVKKLRKIPGLRLIGVWVGLDATEKFETNLKKEIQSGELVIPEGEEESSFLRARIKDIVKDIEYGIVSGVFEFTILNDNFDSSMAQLRDAAEYCFR
jgi:hypothetical protein